MATRKQTNRREFLKLTAFGAASAAVLAACSQPAPAPTAAPAAPKAAEPTKAPEAAKPTAAPAAAAKPTEAAAAKPTEAAKPAAAPAANLKEIPRNKTFIAVRGGTQGKFIEWDQWNPFVPVANHQFAVGLMYEPLAFYSAFGDKEYLWLAESYKYSADFKECVIKVRSGINWSDGKPFTAEDVTYTLNTAAKAKEKIRWGTNIAQMMEKAETVDPTTVKCTLKYPAPRFFWQLTYHFDIGLYIVPKHIFEGQDISTFTHFDMAKGWPVTTSPWRVAAASPQQKVLDRAADWWGVKAGVGQLPAMERFILLPDQGEQQLVQSVIKDEVDFTTGIQPTSFPTVLKGNAKATSWTGDKNPYGYVDWWPHSMYVNTTLAPWDDKNVRWALSYYLDRNKVVEVAWAGSSEVTPLPMPSYPPLKPYFDAVKPMLEKYNTVEFNPKKGDELLSKKGWKKVNNMWQDEKGQPVKIELISFFDFTSVGPVVVEMLKRAGIEASYAEPPDMFDRFSTGKHTGALFGHGGSCKEPFETLMLYQTASTAIPGGHAVNLSRWHNEAYDKIVDEAAGTAPTDVAKLTDIWKRAMEIWLPELPDIMLTQGLHRLPWTTKYWTGMPDAKNPYTNSAQWHLTFPLVLHNVKPA